MTELVDRPIALHLDPTRTAWICDDRSAEPKQWDGYGHPYAVLVEEHEVNYLGESAAHQGSCAAFWIATGDGRIVNPYAEFGGGKWEVLFLPNGEHPDDEPPADDEPSVDWSNLTTQPHPMWVVVETIRREPGVIPGLHPVIGWTPHPDDPMQLAAVVADQHGNAGLGLTQDAVLHYFDSRDAALDFRAALMGEAPL